MLVAFASLAVLGSTLSPAAIPLQAQRAPLPADVVRKGEIHRWDEGLPLGNGTLGVLVWGEGNRIRISMDRGDLWDLRRPKATEDPAWTWETMRRLRESGDHGRHIELFDRPYDAFPFPTKLPGGRAELVLDERFRIDGFRLDLAGAAVEVNVSRPLDGMARLSGSLRVRLHPAEPIVRVSGFWVDRVELVRPAGFEKLGAPDAAFSSGGDKDNGWVAFEQETAGGAQALAARWGVSEPPHSGQPYLHSVCLTLLGGAAGSDLSERAVALAGTATDAYRSVWPRDSVRRWSAEQPWVRIPHVELQAQYDLAAYLYRATTAEGAPPMPLQGLWCADEGGLPPWKGDYHNDLNTQMTYAPYLAANLWDAGRVWLDFNSELLPRYRQFAEEFYGLGKGAAVVPGVMALDGSPLGGWGQYSLSPTNGAWIAWQFAEHWRFSGDRRFLEERAAPFCFSVGKALLGLLEEVEPGGPLRLPLSTSPEYGDNRPEAWLNPNSNYDQALLRALFAACAEMAGAVGDKAQGEHFVAALGRLEPLDVDAESGALTIARGVPLEGSHRHFSHALAIHPLGLLDPSSAADAAVIGATLDGIDALGTRAWVGYSFAWNAAMNAVAGRGDRALERLEQYLLCTGPNGFHLNGQQRGESITGFTYRPFTLEGNFLAMDAIHRMLLEARPGRLRLFPAVPVAWPAAEFSRLRAHGGLEVSARRGDGATQEVTLFATEPIEFLLADPFPGRPTARWSKAVERAGAGKLRITLGKGQTLRGVADGKL